MAETSGDRTLVNLWRKGDQDAAQKLFERYTEKLVSLARRRISERLASRVDPEDVVQSVFRTFFHRARQGQFSVNDPDDLCKLLVRITMHKTLRQIEFHKAGKRDPSLEAGQGQESQERLHELLDREPTPEAANTFVDQLESFLGQLAPKEREIVELRMQGYSSEEIADQLHTYDRRIRRVMERVRAVAETMWKSEGDEKGKKGKGERAKK